MEKNKLNYNLKKEMKNKFYLSFTNCYNIVIIVKMLIYLMYLSILIYKKNAVSIY